MQQNSVFKETLAQDFNKADTDGASLVEEKSGRTCAYPPSVPFFTASSPPVNSWLLSREHGF